MSHVSPENDLTGQSRSDCHLCGNQLCKPGSEAVQLVGYGVDDRRIRILFRARAKKEVSVFWVVTVVV